MKARFHSMALDEFAETVSYYKEVDLALAKRFRASVRAMVTSIEKAPLLGQLYIDDVRKRVLSDFPYVIYYQPFERLTMIIAVMHTSRQPDYWLDRID